MKDLMPIVSQVAQLEQLLIESQGELTPEIESMLVVKEQVLPQEVDRTAFLLERLAIVEKWHKQKAAEYSDLAKKCSEMQERIRSNIKSAMQLLGVTEVEGGVVKYSLARTKPKLLIEDESAVPENYKVSTVVINLDKERLREDLNHLEIPGAKLEESYALRTYAIGLKVAKGSK